MPHIFKRYDTEIHTGDKIEQGKIVIFTATPTDESYTVNKWIITDATFEAGTGVDGNRVAKVKITANTDVKDTKKDAKIGLID